MNKLLFLGYFFFFILGFKNYHSLFDKPGRPFLSRSAEGKTLAIDTLFIQSYNNELLTSFYKENNNNTVWLKTTGTRELLLKHLNSCETDGLNATEFELDKLNDYERKIDALEDSELILYDILLTLKLQKYIRQLSNGRINPKTLYRDWDLPENRIDINAQLLAFEKGDSIAEKIEKLRPNHIQYKKLKTALQIINAYPPDTIECIAYNAIINKKDINPTLIPIKKKLIYWKDLNAKDSLTPVYDEETFVAVKKFQMRNGIYVDGIIGRNTIEVLNHSQKERKEQIISNLERWKWFPRNFGSHYIMINLPEYYLYIVKNGDTIEKKQIVVGSVLRKTPILSSTFSSIVFNPTWTVPPTILEEDLVPSATKNRAYFTSRNITIYDWKNKIVDPANWNPDKYKNYRYVQSPGDHNSLGNVKFNYPNHYSVYLHDTNHRSFFKYSFRSLSSGCVRVENPLPLAAYLLNDNKNWNLEKINKIIETKETITINLREKINIHQLYWTAGLDENGNLKFLTDIYSLDEELNDKLSN